MSVPFSQMFLRPTREEDRQGVLTRINNRLGRNTWPPDDLTREVWEEIEWLAALRESDDQRIRMLATLTGFGSDQHYVIVPIPRQVSTLKANLLFGDEPEIIADAPDDQSRLEEMIDANDLASELHRAAVLSSSEGEVWGRICVDALVLDAPIIEFVSRRWVLPRFAGAYGRFLAGATFVTEMVEGSGLGMTSTVWRILEDYGRGYIETALYRGTSTQLGERRPLTDRPETADLAANPVQTTGIPEPLCVYIPNALDHDPTRGVTDYLGVIHGFLAINEVASIGQANARLTGLKRLFVDGRYKNARGNLPSGQDVFWTDSGLADGLGANQGIKQAEYSFESSELKAWHDHLIDLTLSLAGVAPASIGRGLEQGRTTSGTALRLRMAHTLMEAAGSGRYFDKNVAKLLRWCAQLDAALFGNSWSSTDKLPAVLRGDGLPRDESEEATQISTLRTAKSMSIFQAVSQQHPDWSEEQVKAEVDRIKQDEIDSRPPPNTLGPGGMPAHQSASLDQNRRQAPNPQPSEGGTSR